MEFDDISFQYAAFSLCKVAFMEVTMEKSGDELSDSGCMLSRVSPKR